MPPPNPECKEIAAKLSNVSEASVLLLLLLMLLLLFMAKFTSASNEIH